MIETDQLKEVTYIHNNQLRRVRYLVQGSKIYFSGIEFPSTINAAEAIASIISYAEEVHWSDVTFYDIQTHAGGYRPSDETYYWMDQLVLEGKGDWPSDCAWIPQGIREHGIVQESLGNLKLPGIPEDILEAFGII